MKEAIVECPFCGTIVNLGVDKTKFKIVGKDIEKLLKHNKNTTRDMRVPLYNTLGSEGDHNTREVVDFMIRLKGGYVN